MKLSPQLILLSLLMTLIIVTTPREIIVEGSSAGVTEVRVVSTITAYTSDLGETDDSPLITASNREVREGVIACPRKYKFGTQVEIDSKIYVCEDRMAIKYDDRFDIWMASKQEALVFGKQVKTIKIYE